MPLVRPAAAQPNPAAPLSQTAQRELLRHGTADERRHAARALATDPADLPLLVGRIGDEPEPRVRDALFASVLTIGGGAAAAAVAAFVRSEDAGLRSKAVDTLKRLGLDAEPALDALLADPDADVRLLAVEVTRAWVAARAAPRLRQIIDNEPSVNVCAAAVDVATEVGTSELVAPLQALRRRFAGEAFLCFAVDVACSRIHATAP